MRKETQQELDQVLDHLKISLQALQRELLGEQTIIGGAHENGPLAHKLRALAELADGAPITDMERARKDLLDLFGCIHHLRGGIPYRSLWAILSRAHLALADPITEQEAKSILGIYHVMLDDDISQGYYHPLVQKNGTYSTHDGMRLGKPTGKVCYARYEIEARKRRYDEIDGISQKV